jgi:hypothetical protein
MRKAGTSASIHLCEKQYILKAYCVIPFNGLTASCAHVLNCYYLLFKVVFVFVFKLPLHENRDTEIMHYHSGAHQSWI